jgi:hypothetical protein
MGTGLFIVEDPTMTVKYRMAIKALFLYLNLCQNVMLNSLSCSFTPAAYLLLPIDAQRRKKTTVSYGMKLHVF